MWLPNLVEETTMREQLRNILVLAVIMTIVYGPAIAASVEAPIGNAERGRELFVRNGCFACHGYDGQGGSYTGPQIAPNPLPWQAIAVFIRNPRGLNPPYLAWPFNVMPPFTSRMVSDADVQDIYAYLKSRPAPTNVKNIPTFKKQLQEQRDEQIRYQR
jgi:ubiquinol-cytochrome c reductase cytochrome c subunit